MDAITFQVVGTPKPQPRPRAFARRFNNGVVAARVYDAGTAEGWKSLVAQAAKPFLPARPIGCALKVGIGFIFARPRGHFGSGRNACVLKGGAPIDHTGKPDCDNLAKAVLDCLMQIGMFADDGQIVRLNVGKRYSNDGRAGAVITIEPLYDEPADGPEVDEPALFQIGGAR